MPAERAEDPDLADCGTGELGSSKLEGPFDVSESYSLCGELCFLLVLRRFEGPYAMRGERERDRDRERERE